MLKVKKYCLENKIFCYNSFGFGDTWALTNYLLRVSEESGRKSRFSTTNGLIRDRIIQIRPFLKSKGEIFIITKPSEKELSNCEPYGVKFVPTIRRWNPDCRYKSKIVAYQFDGVSYQDKLLPFDILNFLLNELRRLGYKPVDVGHHKPIGNIVNTLANCRFFVGCPSGISHIAMSVRCPIYLITWNLNSDFLSHLKRCEFLHANAKWFARPVELVKFVRHYNHRIL